MPKSRRLSDLYVRGRELSLDDGSGEPVKVYVKKMTPVDHEAALRGANAARSRTLSVRRDVNSDEYQAMWGEVEGYEHSELLTYLALEEAGSREPVVEAELAAEEEWSKDDYLQGLRDAWVDLEETYHTDPDDVDAKRCFDELARFAALVDERVAGDLESLRRDFAGKSVEALRELVFEKIVAAKASMSWLLEYRRQEVFLSTYDPDRKLRYFEKRSEVDEIAAEVFAALSNAYREISVDPLEGKDLEETPSSSDSSASPEAAAMGASSGPTAAAA